MGHWEEEWLVWSHYACFPGRKLSQSELSNQATLDITAEEVYGNEEPFILLFGRGHTSWHLIPHGCILLRSVSTFFPLERVEWMRVNTTSAQSFLPKTDFIVACLQFSFRTCWWRLWFGGQRNVGVCLRWDHSHFLKGLLNVILFFPDRTANEWNFGQD